MIRWMAALALPLAGCAMAPLPPAPASVALVDRIAVPGMPSFAVGVFAPGPGLPKGADKSLAVRASAIRPETGSFAAYLGAALGTQLATSGKLDSASPLVISGLLVENQVSAGVGTLAAEFTVTRAGAPIYRKRLSVRREWSSSFIGAAAIPAADLAYSGLYTALIARLFDDSDFRAAVMGRS